MYALTVLIATVLSPERFCFEFKELVRFEGLVSEPMDEQSKSRIDESTSSNIYYFALNNVFEI